jgi:hypothetical protein
MVAVAVVLMLLVQTGQVALVVLVVLVYQTTSQVLLSLVVVAVAVAVQVLVVLGVLAAVVCAVISGSTLGHLGMPAFVQPTHLLSASLIFGLQFLLWMEYRYAAAGLPAAAR